MLHLAEKQSAIPPKQALAGLGCTDYDYERVFPLIGLLPMRWFQAGEVLLRQGEAAERAYVLLHGRVEVRVQGREGPRKLAELGAGEIVGEMGLLRRGPRTATVVAESNVKVLVLGREAFEAMCTHSAGFRGRMERLFEHRSRAHRDLRRHSWTVRRDRHMPKWLGLH